MRRVILLVLAAVMTASTLFSPVTVKAKDCNSDIKNIVEYCENNETSFTAGDSQSDWLVIAMKRAGINVDYEDYLKKTDEYLKNNSSLKATDYERAALLKSCFGTDKEWIQNVIETYTGKLGIMSYIYGLILINSNSYEINTDYHDYINEILKCKLNDGGYALNGKYADADVTAMVIQALAPYSSEYKNEINDALLCLSKKQNKNGTFSSYGLENAESTAQVIIALCSLNIDIYKDSRFIKDSNLYDALLLFKNTDNGYKHTQNSNISDRLSTAQVLTALVSIELNNQGKGYVYNFDGRVWKEQKIEPEDLPETETIITDLNEETKNEIEQETENTEETESETEQETESETEKLAEINTETDGELETEPVNSITGRNIKIIIISVISVVGIAAIIISILKHRKYAACSAAIIMAILLTFTIFSRIETKEEHYDSICNNGSTVTYITIVGHDSAILDRREIYVEEGDSVFTQLQNAMTKNKINYDYEGSEILSNIYIKGIDGLNEFDYGTMSGWTYTVDGEFVNVSCSSYKLKEGSEVIWKYVEGGEEQ